MHFAASIVPVSPLRKEASHRSEMVSQLLFGECIRVLEETKDFIRVKSLYDGYEGWCQRSQLTMVDEAFCSNNHQLLTAEPISIAEFNGKPMMLPPGCFIGCFDNGILQIGSNTLVFSQEPFGFDDGDDEADIFEIMHPYIKLPRDAYQQAELGETVGFLQEAQLGDLAFFDNEEGRITHVGILLNSENIIHASGKVRMDKLDSMGIVHAETGERTHRLRVVKRYK